MATLSAPSKNPFRTNAVTPSSTGSAPQFPQPDPTGPAPPTTSPSPTPPMPAPAPPEPRAPSAQTRPTADDFNVGPPLEEPPPYTARPSPAAGETTIEQGPSRPFQPAPATPQPRATPTHTGSSFFSPASTLGGRRGRRGGLLQRLADTLESVADDLNSSFAEHTGDRTAASAQRQNYGWTASPGQPRTQPQAQYAPPAQPPPPNASLRADPPPRHPTSPSRSVSPSASSDFARDFYAAGAAEPAASPRRYTPPPGPPPQLPSRPPPVPLGQPAQTHRQTPSAASDFARDFYAAGADVPVPGSSNQQVPDDGRPTTTPVVGHPLLNDGKILVYPKRHECDKCHNIGYKKSNPHKPCKKCWHKYAKPFSGPIAYSFSNTNNPDDNFQRPLRSIPSPPPPPPAMSPPASSYSSSYAQPARFTRGGFMDDHRGGLSAPRGVRPMGFGRPPPGAVVYAAGDPRIGGQLCWRCEGRGSTSFLILDRITCEVCGGIGRTF